jgi:hypothetical protein
MVVYQWGMGANDIDGAPAGGAIADTSSGIGRSGSGWRGHPLTLG